MFRSMCNLKIVHSYLEVEFLKIKFIKVLWAHRLHCLLKKIEFFCLDLVSIKVQKKIVGIEYFFLSQSYSAKIDNFRIKI